MLSLSRHGGQEGSERDPLSASRHGDGKAAGATKGWGLLRNTVRAISGTTAQKEHGGVDTLSSSRHGGDRDPLSSSRHGTTHTHDEHEATVAMAALFPVKSTNGSERDPLASSRHGGGGGKGGVDPLSASRHGDGKAAGATKGWGLLRNTVRAISGTTAQKEHGGVDTLSSSRHGGDRDPLSSSRHGTTHTHDEHEATVAMAALFPVKSTTGPVKSMAALVKSGTTGPVKSVSYEKLEAAVTAVSPNKDLSDDSNKGGSKDIEKSAVSFSTDNQGKAGGSKALLIDSSAASSDKHVATAATAATAALSSKSSLSRDASFSRAKPDFADGDERAYSPAGKTHKTVVDKSIVDIPLTDSTQQDGKPQIEEEDEDETLENERLTKMINDVLRKKK